jgi:dipeptidyl aminopeptidase/acylaminoacyl peptidase
VRLSGLWLDGADVYWGESRPSEQGRTALLRKQGNEPIQEIVPVPFSVRTRVHEYGGGAFAAIGGLVVFANDVDQRLYRIDHAAREPVPLTPPGPARYADLQFDHKRERVICVVERGRGGGEPENFLASVPLATGKVTPLHRGADFYAFPRVDPAGEHLAFLAWNHPAMPWDACELHVAEIQADGSLATPVKVAGGAGESIFQPAWSPSGELHFVSDRGGFSNLYRCGSNGTATCICPMEADFTAPLWVFGLSTYAWLDDSTLACLFQRSGLWHLATLATATGRLDEVETELTELGPIFASRGHAVFAGGSAGQGTALYSFDQDTRGLRLVHRPAPNPLPPSAISHPRVFDFPTSEDAVAHGLFYPPFNPDHEAMPSHGSHIVERPPLLVMCHGGPTASASTALNLNIQFWTSRGFAVLDVNYRGSTGYGRAYRKMLDGQWGVADVEDCVAGARALAEEGLVDGGRMAIRGSSAGGFTVLCALAFHDVFAAGASYYGVCDLEALATDTHKFESRYLESLIGPFPARRDLSRKTPERVLSISRGGRRRAKPLRKAADAHALYRARSPLQAADRISCPVIFFHGLQDRVVPPAQAEAMATALRRRGLAAPLLLFADEQHGFRRKESIQAALTAELDFYREVFGITGWGK